MSLNELKLIEEEIIQDYNYDPEQLLTLKSYLKEGKTKIQFQYRLKILTLRGEPEDFKIFLNNRLVCECVCGCIYNDNSELVRELLD